MKTGLASLLHTKAAMSREEINIIFEKLAVLTGGDRSAVWRVIADLKAQNPERTPTLGDVLDRLLPKEPKKSDETNDAALAASAER